MFSVEIKNGGFTVIVYAVVWRFRTVKASVLVAGISGTVDAADATRLAQKQQARIVAALK